MKEKALDNKCPSCGSPLLYKPKKGKWICDHCNSEFDLETLKKYNNASSDENNKKEETTKEEVKNSKKEKKTEENVTYISYKCKNCGAEIIADEQTASTFCVYCGNTAILKSKLSGEFAPSKIIPFKHEKQDAIYAFKSLNKGRPLMPKFFNDEKNIEKIRGVYIPFWLFDYEIDASLKVKATNITTWMVGNYQYTKKDVYDVEREGVYAFEKVPVDGSTRFDDDIMNTIEPFDYSEMVPYNHAYLSGFLAEKYDVNYDVASKDAYSRCEKTTDVEINSSIKAYTTKITTSKQIKEKSSSHEYVLLPVWMVNVKYNDKNYIFAMNAQTGEFVGNIPIDKKKAFWYTVLFLIVIFVVAMIISYLIYLRGK